MLSRFHALPTEERARSMKGRDYLWCLVNELADKEEALERLCPECRGAAERSCCPACGRPREQWGEGAVNAAFDWNRFEQLRGDGG